MKVIALLLLSAVISGCGIFVTKPMGPAQETVHNHQTHGYLVGSVSFSGDRPKIGKRPIGARDNFRYIWYRFFLTNRDKGTPTIRADISNIPDDKFGYFKDGEGDYTIDEGLGYVFVLPLPAGEYKFYTYSYGAVWEYFPEEDFDLAVEIKPGEINYVGEIHFQHLFGKNFLDMHVSNGANIIFEDGASRDMPIIQKMYPFLTGLPSTKAILDSESRTITKTEPTNQTKGHALQGIETTPDN